MLFCRPIRIFFSSLGLRSKSLWWTDSWCMKIEIRNTILSYFRTNYFKYIYFLIVTSVIGILSHLMLSVNPALKISKSLFWDICVPSCINHSHTLYSLYFYQFSIRTERYLSFKYSSNTAIIRKRPRDISRDSTLAFKEDCVPNKPILLNNTAYPMNQLVCFSMMSVTLSARKTAGDRSSRKLYNGQSCVYLVNTVIYLFI